MAAPARAFADTVAPAFRAFRTGQSLGTGQTQTPEHGQYGHDNKEKGDDL
ncbi:MAG: hypothetical protein AB3N11_01810 [Arenibacterium sp.]